MTYEIVTIPCLDDNYAFVLHDSQTGTTALFDAPEASPILEALATRGWALDMVFLTHHHHDHVEGLQGILARHPAKVIGAKADAHRLPPLDRAVTPDDQITLGRAQVQVIDVSGHTLGHLAYHVPAAKAAFTGDSLMALGCGRIFEGTPQMMWDSLQKLAALPPETLICSGHEYTAANGRFALTIEPGNPALLARIKAVNAARAANQPTVPSTLAEELATNPFLRADQPEVQASVGLKNAPLAEVFARVRKAKDTF